MAIPYKYKTSFANEITASSNIPKDQLDLSKASLESLRSLLPEEMDLDANVDLIAVAFNAAVVNVFNKNHDGISTDTAKAVSSYFTHKPTNIEHKKEKVVGHVVSSGFSTYGSNNILDKEDINSLEPFNIALSSVIYKTVNPDFADLIEKSTDANNSLYNAISASWEIGFNDFLIAVGSKNLEEAEIISDQKHINELKKYLKAFDGDGLMNDGTEIYRLVSGDVYPLGIGFTTNPAANVSGLIKLENKKKDQEEKVETLENPSEGVEKIEVNTEDFLKKIIKNKKKPSHNAKQAVISDNAKLNSDIQKMEIKEIINELKETIEASASDKFSEEAVANIVKVVTDAIKEKSDIYVQEKAETEKQKLQAEEAKAESEQKISDLEANLAESQDKLSKIEADVAESRKLQIFNDRMDSIDSEYELSDQDRSILVEDLNKLDETDESFASFSEKMKVLFSHKSKKNLEEQEKVFAEKLEAEIQKRLTSSENPINASEQVEETSSSEEVEEVLENVEANEEITSNNGDSIDKEVSLKDQFKNAFSKESITIKY
jgi:hypothetical protein